MKQNKIGDVLYTGHCRAHVIKNLYRLWRAS